MLLFQLYQTIGHFGVNFVLVCRHSNELSVTETNTGYVKNRQYPLKHPKKLKIRSLNIFQNCIKPP